MLALKMRALPTNIARWIAFISVTSTYKPVGHLSLPVHCCFGTCLDVVVFINRNLKMCVYWVVSFIVLYSKCTAFEDTIVLLFMQIRIVSGGVNAGWCNKSVSGDVLVVPWYGIFPLWIKVGQRASVRCTCWYSLSTINAAWGLHEVSLETAVRTLAHLGLVAGWTHAVATPTHVSDEEAGRRMTLLVGQQEEHPGCNKKKSGTGSLVTVIWLELCTS